MDSLLKRLENAYRLLYGRGKVHSQSHFATILGKSKSQISDAFKERYGKLTSGLLELIADTFPDDINKEYMLTGEGSVEKISSLGGIPHYSDISVAAGHQSGFNVEASEVEMRPEPYGIPDAEFSLNVSGYSMYPELHDGDIIFCKEHIDRQNWPLNKICVIDSPEGGVVKQLVNVTDEKLTLHSFNPEYKDYDIHRSDINKLFVVVGVNRKY